MDTNFHAFVFITTIVFYIILRSYKKKEPEHKKTSNLIYVLAIPIILYGGHYFFYKDKDKSVTLNNSQLTEISSHTSEDLLSIPYPVTSDSTTI